MNVRQKKRIIHHIEPSWCKGCGICVHFCPRQVLALDENGRVYAAEPQSCIGCRLCELRCPDLAIAIEQVEAPEVQSTEEEPG